MPSSVVYGAVAAILVVLAVVGFVLLRDKPPTKEINMLGRDKLKPPPAAVPPPAWVIEKLQHGGG